MKKKKHGYFITFKLFYDEINGVEKDGFIYLDKKIKRFDIIKLRENILSNNNLNSNIWKDLTFINILYLGKVRNNE